MIRIAVVIIALLIVPLCQADMSTTKPAWMEPTPEVDREVPRYDRLPDLSGTIHSVGSPTTNALIWAWAEDFKKLYPKVEFDLKGGRSATVLPAMLGKTPPNVGSMSRLMSDDEVASFKKQFGYEPTAIRVAVNAIGVFVNADNECPGLTFAQLDAIFSRTFKAGHKAIYTWGEAGLRGDWENERILPYSLDVERGEYATFKSKVLLDGEFRYDVKTELTVSGILQDVAVDRGSIGYASMLYRTRRARPLAIQAADGKFYEPTYDNCESQRYPLAGFLYIYINKPPGRPLDRPTREFLTFACCQLGQELAAREGAFPLTAKLAREQLDLIGK